MKQLFISKIKESLISVLPVTLIVIILNLTPIIDLGIKEIVTFIVSAMFLILGIGLFFMVLFPFFNGGARGI